MKLSISAAARRAGVQRTTIYRKIKSGALSVEEDDTGNPVIEFSELVRLYPDAGTGETASRNRKLQQGDTEENDTDNRLLQAEIDHLREVVALKDGQIEDLRQATRLLTDQRAELAARDQAEIERKAAEVERLERQLHSVRESRDKWKADAQKSFWQRLVGK